LACPLTNAATPWGFAGDKKIRPGRAHNDHAPDAVGREYRGERRGRKEYFTRKFSAKSDLANSINSNQKLSAAFDCRVQTKAKSIAAFIGKFKIEIPAGLTRLLDSRFN
jgi:hypothetical protein